MIAFELKTSVFDVFLRRIDNQDWGGHLVQRSCARQSRPKSKIVVEIVPEELVGGSRNSYQRLRRKGLVIPRR